jgi:phosphatidylserine/phosphatidylglycerophosphate/cardiolipin synthase-like enzyme
MRVFHTLQSSLCLIVSSRPLPLFRPHANIADEGWLGSDAKICLADDWHAYIGSTNLTGPGLSSNLGMGVVVHGE